MDHRPEVEEILQSLPDLEPYDEIVFCGFGEPTIRLKTLLAVAAEIKKQDKKIRLNTDGLGNLVNKHNILPELGAVIDSVSISLNAQNEEVYNKHCQPQLPGSYQAMLEFVRQAPAYIDEVTVTAINGLDHVDIDACRQMAVKLGVKFRQRELDRVG
jgi:TatD family-associated radical SAM protein